MEITIAILSYLLHCFTAFALIYAKDEAKIYGELNEYEIPKLKMPNLNDMQEEELIAFCENDTEEEKNRKMIINERIEQKNKEKRQKYIDEVIKPATLYFSLLKEIKCYQSECRSGFYDFLIQLFSILLCSKMLIRIELIDSIILTTIVLVTLVFGLSTCIIYLIYKKYWRCRKIRMQHFNYKSFCNSSNIHIIISHYNYLCSIKETVYFRYSIRKILYGASTIILLLFLPIPEY